jgi:hypothetical protein
MIHLIYARGFLFAIRIDARGFLFVIRVDCRSNKFITSDLVISEARRRRIDTDGSNSVLGQSDPSPSLLKKPLKSVSSKGSSLIEPLFSTDDASLLFPEY